MPKALADLNEAIRLDTRQSGFYINRGLVRYQMNNLRGAMADYDQVIGMDRDNLIARFNRGLLRFQVGDNNRAIEDFDVVIELEPENFMAYYNRALLKSATGDFHGVIADLDHVMDQYPNFIPGYYARAEAKKALNDQAGSERDYWTAFEIEKKAKAAKVAQGSTSGTAVSGQHTASINAGTATTGAAKTNTREQSDNNIDKFNRLVVYDREEEQKSKYSSDVRGRVQDKNVRVDLDPLFIITYYEQLNAVKNLVYYSRDIDAFNNKMQLAHKLRLTNQEAALIEDQIALHEASINSYSAKIVQQPTNAVNYFARAMDYMIMNDFDEAMSDFDEAIRLDPSFILAYFNRAVVRYKQLDYTLAGEHEPADMSNMSLHLFSTKNPTQTKAVEGLSKSKKRAYEHEMIMRDYDQVVRLNPDFVYAYFNRANLRCAQRDYRAAILDYDEAIKRNKDFAEAYFNRGLTQLYLGETNKGIIDLSKAGELGMINAYNIIKRMTVSSN